MPAHPQLSFADLEFLHQGIHPDPTLQAVSDLLDQHAETVELVRLDLQRDLKNPGTWRNGINPSQVLRALILMRVKNWDYRELRERIADGCTLRRFTGFDSHLVPKRDAFSRAFLRLTPETLERINRLLAEAAIGLGLEDGSQLRVDTTVVETNIHYPPTPPCYGTPYASSYGWCGNSKRSFPMGSLASPTGPVRPAAACKRSKG